MRWIRRAWDWLFNDPVNPQDVYRKQKRMNALSIVLILIACVEIIISLTISAERLKGIWTILHR